MEIGMLWFDNDKKSPLPQKVARAAAYYKKKYGHKPNLCYIHPKMGAKETPNAGSIAIKSSETILPHHFWIGVEKNPHTKI